MREKFADTSGSAISLVCPVSLEKEISFMDLSVIKP
jgi:hypothetical protein